MRSDMKKRWDIKLAVASKSSDMNLVGGEERLSIKHIKVKRE